MLWGCPSSLIYWTNLQKQERTDSHNTRIFCILLKRLLISWNANFLFASRWGTCLLSVPRSWEPSQNGNRKRKHCWLNAIFELDKRINSRCFKTIDFQRSGNYVALDSCNLVKGLKSLFEHGPFGSSTNQNINFTRSGKYALDSKIGVYSFPTREWLLKVSSRALCGRGQYRGKRRWKNLWLKICKDSWSKDSRALNNSKIMFLQWYSILNP